MKESIYIVTYEPKKHCKFAVGGWEWSFEPYQAQKEFESLKEEFSLTHDIKFGRIFISLPESTLEWYDYIEHYISSRDIELEFIEEYV